MKIFIALAVVLITAQTADARIGGFDRRGCDYRNVLYRCDRMCSRGYEWACKRAKQIRSGAIKYRYD